MHIRDADLHVQSSGQGTPFVWAHGLMSSMESDDALDWFGLARLAASARLIRYDARCHGKSHAPRRPGACHWHNLGADMLAVADAMDAAGFIAGGMSMGSATAIHAAVQAPSRIKGLVLAMPPMIWETRTMQRQLYKRIAQRGRALDGRVLAKLMSRDMARTLPAWLVDAAPDQAAGMAIGLGAIDRRTMHELFHSAAISDLPPREALAPLAGTPALILGWSGDLTHPMSSAHELHRLLPGSELHIAHDYAEFTAFPQRIADFVQSVGGAAPELPSGI